MAASDAVWGIEIGQCALKALRCRSSQDDKSKLLADAFDYVEYPAIIGQPDVDPAQVVRDALKTFLSRNSVRDDRVALGVSGQNGLARFIKLPPVEAKKIPDIVRYEARQQIPFKLEDVVWDYQKMPGGSEEEGFALEAEVGLFAMKREQVFRSLRPLEEVGVEVNFVQLTPLAIFNAVVFDQLLETDSPPPYNPENPPKATVILSVGTDTSDLVVTNGYRVWQRSIPIGGNHFTKALTKQLQLTFAKAEHLKRNTRAAKPEDAKALFKAMKPVFGDLLMEVQTSIRYFRMNVDKEAHIKQVIALGSAMKLPGLRRYLEQNLDMPVSQLDGFRRLAGSAVLSAPTFKENVLSFGVCYGLALQGLGRSILRTNLLPQEINTARMIDEKKPWALAAATVLLLGFTVSYFGHWLPWYGATDSQYTKAFADVDGVVGRATAQKSAYATAESEYKTAIETGERLVGNVEGRMQLPELIRAINACLPQNDKDPEAQPENNSTRKDLMITSFGCWLKGDMSEWFTKEVRDEWQKANPGKEIAAEDVKSDGGAQEKPEGAGDAGGGPDGEVPPQGETAGGEGAERRPGYIVELRGHHFHNSDPKEPAGAPYVQQTLISALESGEVELPGEGGKPEKVRLRDLGIRYPTLVYSSELTDVPNPAYDKGDPASKQPPRLKKFDFYLQFWWEARPRSARLQKAADEKKKAAAAAEDGAAANGAPGE